MTMDKTFDLKFQSLKLLDVIVASAHQWQRPLLLTTPLQRNLPGEKKTLKFVAAKSTRDRHFLDFDAGPQRECPYFKLAYKNQMENQHILCDSSFLVKKDMNYKGKSMKNETDTKNITNAMCNFYTYFQHFLTNYKFWALSRSILEMPFHQ